MIPRGGSSRSVRHRSPTTAGVRGPVPPWERVEAHFAMAIAHVTSVAVQSVLTGTRPDKQCPIKLNHILSFLLGSLQR